jgi:hypothetical protein
MLDDTQVMDHGFPNSTGTLDWLTVGPTQVGA